MTSTGTQASGGGAPFAGVTVAIENDLDIAVDVYDVFNPAAAGQAAPYTYTKLGTVGAKSSGSVKTIRLVSLLEAMYTGPVAALQGTFYRQFPVKLMSGTQFGADNPPPLSYKIVDADRQAMEQSFLFHKFAMANPDSALTKSLNDALQNKNGDTFFAGTQNFKGCTLGSWNAVMAWLNMFTSGWQGPYYLYEAAPPSPPAGYVPALVATLNIASTASSDAATLTLCGQDADGTIKPSVPARTAALAMVGDGTMASDSSGQGVDAALRPVWMNVIQTASEGGKPQTSYIAGPTLTGTVAGTKVVSTQKPMASQKGAQGSGKASGLDSLFSGKNFNTLCQVVGFVVGVVMLYEIVEKKLSGKDAADEQSKSESQNETELQQKTADNGKAATDAIAETAKDPKIATDSASVADGYKEIATDQQKSVMSDTIQSEKQSLNDAINQEMTDGGTPSPEFETAVQDTVSKLDAAQQQIDSGNLEGASTTMGEASQSMQQTIEQSQDALQQSETDALNSSVEAVNDATSSADALNEAQDAYEKQTSSAENDSGAPTEDETPEVEPFAEA